MKGLSTYIAYITISIGEHNYKYVSNQNRVNEIDIPGPDYKFWGSVIKVFTVGRNMKS